MSEEKMKDSMYETQAHILTVQKYLSYFVKQLLDRASNHDASKLKSPEVEIFHEYTPKLAGVTYNSKEYKEFMKEMEVALSHHYSKNRHHPEHFPDGIKDMNLIDVVEMICDWKAATLRHHDGNILKSLEDNQKRFKYSDELKNILINTVTLFDQMVEK
jgi:hypothetical protein